MGYGVPAKYDYATQDWNNNIQHRDQNFPAGVAVPVYYSWTGTLDGVRKNWGHIAVRLADGRVWTDGKYYANVNELSRLYLSGSSYLGWGELVNGVRVIEQVKEANMPEKVNLGTARILAECILGRDRASTHAGSGDADLNKFHVGRELTNGYIYQLWTSAEAGAYQNYLTTVENFYRTYKDQIAELSSRPTKAQLEQLGQALQAEQAKVAEAQKELEEAKKQGGISPEDSQAIRETNTIVKAIKQLLERIFK
jgi:hypothetical protein